MIRKTYRQRVLELTPAAELERETLMSTYAYSIRVSGGRLIGESFTSRGAWKAALDYLLTIRRVPAGWYPEKVRS